MSSKAMNKAAVDEYVRRVVAEAPPLTDDQRHHISALLWRHMPGQAPPPPPRVEVHYDAAGRCLFTGPACDDLRLHVQARYVERTERRPPDEACELDRSSVFGDQRRSIDYLIEHDDLSWLMPVQHVDPDAAPLPQVKPRPRRFA